MIVHSLKVITTHGEVTIYPHGEGQARSLFDRLSMNEDVLDLTYYQDAKPITRVTALPQLEK